MKVLEFFQYYAVFFLLLSYISGLIGIQVLSGTEGFDSLVASKSAIDLLNPLYLINILLGLFTVSSAFTLIYLIFAFPFLIGLVIIAGAFIRGWSI